MSDPYQQQDPYAKNPYGPPPQAPQPGYGYPQQDPYQQQQPQGYGYPQQDGYGYGGGPTGQNNGLAIASLVVGIVSVVGVCFFGWLTGIVAVGLGVAGLNKSKTTGTGRGQAIAGIVCGGIGLLIGLILFVVLISSNSFSSTY
ncbi:DUF4190 domain-containing protein [Streptacidiphilus cavernicola]|uniref:DUF4190 domain-containing protein n=1 Tax=Streptacidiphilus cavernicola TaxID=3342716 RepID=A0ABV6VTI4_9ACTN